MQASPIGLSLNGVKRLHFVFSLFPSFLTKIAQTENIITEQRVGLEKLLEKVRPKIVLASFSGCCTAATCNMQRLGLGATAASVPH